jgi:hypothetical protein
MGVVILAKASEKSLVLKLFKAGSSPLKYVLN